MDLEYILGVISDGPTKSLAYRRLQYLMSKFDMYYLLHEYEEVADMKVRATLSRPLLYGLTKFEQNVPHRCLTPFEVSCVIPQLIRVLGTFTMFARLIPMSTIRAA